MMEPLDDSKKVKSGGAATEDIELGPVPKGLTWVVNHVAVEDETTAFTSVRVGVGQANDFRPLEEHIGGVAGELYTVPEPIYVPEGKFLQVRFVGTLSGDKLAVYINGHQERR